MIKLKKFRRDSFFHTYSGKQSFILFCIFVAILYLYAAYSILTEQSNVIVKTAGSSRTILWGGYASLILAVMLSIMLIWAYVEELK